MAGLQSQFGHWQRTVGGVVVDEGDNYLCNNTSTAGHQYVSGQHGDAQNITEFSGQFGTYYSGHIDQITTAQRDHNAWYIKAVMETYGWSFNAICAVIGNMQAESGCNPGVYEGKYLHAWPSTFYGVGLVQWTPNYKMFQWLHDNGDLECYTIESQIARIAYEVEQDIQYGRVEEYPWSGYCPQTFDEFMHSTDTAYQLAKCFYFCYERPATSETPNAETYANRRGDNANYFVELFGGTPPPTGRTLPPWLLFQFSKQFKRM